MTSITWNVNDKSALLNVDSNKLEVNYTGKNMYLFLWMCITKIFRIKISRLHYLLLPY
jgi:hypothetical protein